MKPFIRKRAIELGFGACGVTTADPVDVGVHLVDAIRDGRTADMKWLARDPAARCDPASLLPGAKSVICCALAYGDRGLPRAEAPLLCKEGMGEVDHDLPPPNLPLTKGEECVARFARGADYHEVVREKLEGLWKSIEGKARDVQAKLCVDTSPILEKALAQRAGLGWIGKHTILLNEELGSWFVLGEIITDLELGPDAPVDDMCGDCRCCLEACPTGAIVDGRVLDARKCISYLTIEVPRLDSPSHESRVTSHGFSYGCDICQEACPYNSGRLE